MDKKLNSIIPPYDTNNSLFVNFLKKQELKLRFKDK